MWYRGKHAKPLIDRRRLGECLAMVAVEVAGIALLMVAWLNS